MGEKQREETFRWIIEPLGLLENARAYVDGSMYDGFDERLAALGWAFVIVVQGAIVGSANGVPPHYVRSIPAVEAWALAMAVEHVDVESSKFSTDCKSVRDMARAGMRRATSAAQINARVWHVTFARTDGMCPRVEWIPAHLTESHVGVAAIGDGTKLTHEQWAANRLVDEYAKVAARSARRAKEEVWKCLGAMRRVAIVAAWIGRATHAANNGREEPRRDSAPTQGRRQHHDGREKKSRRAAEEGGRRQARPVALGGHSLVRQGEGWKCTVCKKEAKDWNRVAGGSCRGAVAQFWARRARELGGRGGSDGAGHIRAAYGEVVWCIQCGAYAVKHAIGLAGPCGGRPTNASQMRVLKRLTAGRHPRTNQVFEAELIKEVPGARARGGGSSHGQGGSGEWKRDGRRAAGYLRRPGGAKPVAGVGTVWDDEGLRRTSITGGEDTEEDGGPRSVFMKRQREMQLGPSDYRDGDAYEERRNRAYAARARDEEVVDEMCGRWAEAIEEGRRNGEREKVEEERGATEARGGGVGGSTVIVGAVAEGSGIRAGALAGSVIVGDGGRRRSMVSTVMSRKDLMEALRVKVVQEAKRRRTLALEEENAAVGTSDALAGCERKSQGRERDAGRAEGANQEQGKHEGAEGRRQLLGRLCQLNEEQGVKRRRVEERVVVQEAKVDDEEGLASGKRGRGDGGREVVEVKRGKAAVARDDEERGRTAVACKVREGESLEERSDEERGWSVASEGGGVEEGSKEAAQRRCAGEGSSVVCAGGVEEEEVETASA